MDPLTPDDIAEVIVFSATRRENVVIADTLIFPSHQVRSFFLHVKTSMDTYTDSQQGGAGAMHRKS